ncbi:MAG: methyltransferase domain-containing protein [Gemmatimonadetes bacterium]|nr:methyltransferase domain-containing protein [Gemmatimonadota bacterium]
MNAQSVFRESWCAERYEADRFGGPFGEWLRESEVKLFQDLGGGWRGRVLDAGTGTGKLALGLLECGYDVTAVDFSRPMLKIAKEKFLARRPSGKFLNASIAALCFADRSFDHTVCSRVLMHLDDWAGSLAEMCRVTRHTIILDFPPRCSFAGLESLWRSLRGSRQNGARPPYRTFKVREVIARLKHHGFTAVQVKRSHFFPLRLHRWINRPRFSGQLERAANRAKLSGFFGAPVTVKAVRDAPVPK